MNKLTPDEQASVEKNSAIIVTFVAQKLGAKVEDVLEAIKNAASQVDTTNEVTATELEEAILGIAEIITSKTETQVDDAAVDLLKQGLKIQKGEKPVISVLQLIGAAIHLIKTGKAEANAAPAANDTGENVAAE